tara:strand:+ start:506 stop:2152 length:1647 start_codon:yes stop_codon:yes gene_type:complete
MTFFSKKIFHFLLLFQVLLCSKVEARWSVKEDSPYECCLYDRNIIIDENGKTEETIEESYIILNEKGRSDIGTFNIIYNSSTEKHKVIEAKTIVEGKEYKVDKDKIVSKPISGNVNGFDTIQQVTISFPKVEIGAKIYLKTKVINHNPALNEHFAFDFYFGSGVYLQKATIVLHSKIPLFIKKNDPHKALEVHQEKRGDLYIIKASNTKPLVTSLTNEATNSIIMPSDQTFMEVSSLNSFESLGNLLVNGYEKSLKVPLMPSLDSIKKEAEKAKKTTDQINAVTSMVSSLIRYMGDWRSNEGRFQPRSLVEILRSGFGDCKDYSVVVGRILRAMGYDVNVALVWRGLPYLERGERLPSLSAFNHAMLKVVDKSGATYWIDPTNMVSMSNFIFPDISNRHALVLKPGKSTYEFIPAIKSSENVTKKFQYLAFFPDYIGVRGNVELRGVSALNVTGLGLLMSLRAIEESFIKEISDDTNPVDISLSLPDLTSRIVKNVVCQYSFKEKDVLYTTTDGSGLDMSSYSIEPILNIRDDHKGALFLGLPSINIR